MFKKFLFLSAFVLLLGISYGIIHIRPKDYALYEELLKSSRPEQESPLLSYSQQVREGVCKQIWYQDANPLYFRIESEESELFFFHQENQIEVVEQLEKVSCIMQEELFYLLPDGREVSEIDHSTRDAEPMQRIRYLEAERACYNYTTQQFVAEEAKLWKFELQGHQAPQHFDKTKPTMSGTAQCVEFSLKGKQLNFQAHRMKATFNPKEELL